MKGDSFGGVVSMFVQKLSRGLGAPCLINSRLTLRRR